eukprot:CFRG1185T1
MMSPADVNFANVENAPTSPNEGLWRAWHGPPGHQHAQMDQAHKAGNLNSMKQFGSFQAPEPYNRQSITNQTQGGGVILGRQNFGMSSNAQNTPMPGAQGYTGGTQSYYQPYPNIQQRRLQSVNSDFDSGTRTNEPEIVLDTRVPGHYQYQYSPITPTSHEMNMTQSFPTANRSIRESGGSTMFNFDGWQAASQASRMQASRQNSSMTPFGSSGYASTEKNQSVDYPGNSSHTFFPGSLTPRQVEAMNSSANQSELYRTQNMPMATVQSAPTWHGYTPVNTHGNNVNGYIEQNLHHQQSLEQSSNNMRQSASFPMQRKSAPAIYMTGDVLNANMLASQSSLGMSSQESGAMGDEAETKFTYCEWCCEEKLFPYVKEFHRIGHAGRTSRVHLKDQNEYLTKIIFDSQGTFKYHLSCLTRLFEISRRRIRRVHGKCLNSVSGTQETHGLKGRPSNNRKAAETRLQFVKFVRDMRITDPQDPEKFYLPERVSSIQGWFPSSLRMLFNEHQEARTQECADKNKTSDDKYVNSKNSGETNNLLSCQTISNSTCQRWFKRYFSLDTFIQAQNGRRISADGNLQQTEQSDESNNTPAIRPEADTRTQQSKSAYENSLGGTNSTSRVPVNGEFSEDDFESESESSIRPESREQ